MKTPTGEPLMDRPLVAILLSISSGILAGFTYATVRLYSTVQSGNVVQVGYALESGASAPWRNAVIAIACFGFGSALTALLQNLMANFEVDYSGVILTFEAILLLVMGFTFVWDVTSPLTYAYIVSLLAGMQGNAFHRVDGFLYGNVAVTLVVQQAFNHLIQAAFGSRRSHLLQSRIFFLVLFGFSTGGYIGAWGTGHLQSHVLWFSAALLGALALWSIVRENRHEPVDISYH